MTGPVLDAGMAKCGRGERVLASSKHQAGQGRRHTAGDAQTAGSAACAYMCTATLREACGLRVPPSDQLALTIPFHTAEQQAFSHSTGARSASTHNPLPDQT